MDQTADILDIELFTTCPQSSRSQSQDYVNYLLDVIRWSENCGFKGALIYTDNSLIDPWLVAQIVLENTTCFHPLIAVQPVYMHPYTVAKMLVSFGYLYHRQVFLNMVAGGFVNDLLALNDSSQHDERYTRLVEYTLLIKQLLDGNSAITFEGDYFKVKNLKMSPGLSPELFPRIFVSGSSDAGLAAAGALDAVAVKYPQPVGEYEGKPRDVRVRSGIRIGVIAREDGELAWHGAYQRFPENRKGQITHQLAMKTSDSVWHTQLSQLAKEANEENNPYWLIPFQNYRTFCPYLVGSYERVSDELARYIAVGFNSFILDIPSSEEELEHTRVVFNLAIEKARRFHPDPRQ